MLKLGQKVSTITHDRDLIGNDRRSRSDIPNSAFFLFLFSLQTTADEYTLKESISNLTRRQYRRPFLILNFLFILMTFSGNFAITFYAVDIFQNVSPFVNEYLSAVIIGIIKFVGALLYIPAIKYVSRRILICGSAFVMGIRYVFLSKKKIWKRKY